MDDLRSTRQVIEAALKQKLIDEDRNVVHPRLLPGLTTEEIAAFAATLSAAPPADVLDLLTYCTGIDGLLDQLDFTGKGLRDGFGLDFLLPGGLPIAHDGFGNYWVVDIPPGAGAWGPIYFCCHDAPVMLLQAATIGQFVSEVFQKYLPPHRSLIEDVHEDRLFEVWRKNPGVMTHAAATASQDPDIRTFASDLDATYEIIDLRDAPIGMGLSWGRYGPRTEVKRFSPRPVFAYGKPAKIGLFSRLFGR